MGDLRSVYWRSGNAKEATSFLAAQRRRSIASDRRLVDALSPQRGDLVIDVGCGTGEMVARLMRSRSDADIVGLDAAPRLLAIARSNTPSAIWACALAEAMPFSNDTADRVLLQRVLMHLPQWRAVVAEVARVLRPGGVLVAYEPTWSRFEFISDEPALDSLLTRHLRAGVAVPDIGERLSEVLRSENFRVIDATWEISMAPIDVSRYEPLAWQLDEEVVHPLMARWVAGWRAVDSRTVSYVRCLTAQLDGGSRP